MFHQVKLDFIEKELFGPIHAKATVVKIDRDVRMRKINEQNKLVAEQQTSLKLLINIPLSLLVDVD